MGKLTKAQKINKIVSDIETSVRHEEIYQREVTVCEIAATEARQKHKAQIEVTRILKERLTAETSTMRKGKGE